MPRSVLIGPPLKSSQPGSFIRGTVGFLSPVVARRSGCFTLMGMHLVDRVKVDQEVRKGKKPPEILVDTLGGERRSLMQLLEAIEDRLAIQPKITGASHMLGPTKEGLPSGKQFRSGNRLDNAGEALSAIMGQKSKESARTKAQPALARSGWDPGWHEPSVNRWSSSGSGVGGK